MTYKNFVRFKDPSGETIELDTDSPLFKFLDIEEDVFGRDKMTFEYKGHQYTGLVFSKYQ